MAAVMSNEISNTDKISIFVAECERMGIKILAPDVNRSSLKFAPEVVDGAGCIRYGSPRSRTSVKARSQPQWKSGRKAARLPRWKISAAAWTRRR
jgi:DNA polymerase-3 subunit alpha